MLRDMRSSISSWSVRILLCLIILSFILSYGFRGSSDGMAEGVAATVDGHEISERDVHLRFQNRVQAFSRFFQRDIPEALLQNLQRETLDQLIDEQLYARAARGVGYAPSDKEVRDNVKRQFADEAGNFDFDRYQKIVRSVFGKTTGTFEGEESRRLLAEHFQELVTRTGWVSEDDLRQKYEANGTKLTLSYVKLDAEKLRGRIVAKPSDADLQAYFQTRAAKYEAPARARYDVAWIPLAGFLSPNERDLEKTLRDMPPEKAKGVRLRAAHILVKATKENEAERRKKIDQIQAQLARGANFEALAAEHSEDSSRQQGGDLGFFGEKDMVAPFEKAALALGEGKVSGPVRSEFGWHLIKLYDKIPAGPATVERLRPELTYAWEKKTFENPKKVERATKLAETVLEAYKAKAGTQDFAAVKDERVRALRTPLVAREDAIAGLPSGKDGALLVSSANALEVGRIGNPIRSLSNRYVYLVKKTETQPATPAEFAAVRARVLRDYEDEKVGAGLKDFAAETLRKAPKGDLAAVAKSLGLTVAKTQPFARPTNATVPGLGQSATLVEKAFATPAGDLVDAPIEIGGAHYLVRVDAKTAPDWTAFEGQKEELRGYAAEEASRARLEAWSHYLRSKASIKQRS